MSQKVNAASGQLFQDWAALTWAKESAMLGPVPVLALNYLIPVALIAGIYFEWFSRFWLALALVLYILWTFGRAGAVMPRRRKALRELYASLQNTAKLPRGTAAAPASPESRIKVDKWAGAVAPRAFTLTVGADAPAALSAYARPGLEMVIQNGAATQNGAEWVFEWPSTNTVKARQVDSDSDDVFIRDHNRKILSALGSRELFNGKQNAADYGYNLEVTKREPAKKGDVDRPFPVEFVFNYGGFDASEPSFKDRVETSFERVVRAPGVWIFDWETDGVLTAELVSSDDVRARRKKQERKLAADVRGQVKTGRGDFVAIEVVKWMAEGKKLPPTYPIRTHINFGTANMGDRRVRARFEDDFDASQATQFPEMVFMYNWIAGAATRCEISAVPASGKSAEIKRMEKKLRNITESQIKSKEFIDLDVLDWEDLEDGATNSIVPKCSRVGFGAYDVSNADTRRVFEDHWSSQLKERDWHFDWDSTPGEVEITAVPKLPTAIAFPEVGDDDYERYLRQFRKGKVLIGLARGGGEWYWDLNFDPHGLIGGKTGSGKSVTLDEILHLAMSSRDLVEVVVCDPKRTDYTWVQEFPNVRFAASAMEICETIGFVFEELQRRQKLLNKRGAKNMRDLRGLYEENPDLEREDGAAPKRLILIFDEIANWWMASTSEDEEEAKKVARSQLEQLGQLARAFEINMVFAAQKPDKERMSTQLKEMCGFRLCVGTVNEYTSKQILDSTHGTSYPANEVPKGRAWAFSSATSFAVVQVPFLPLRSGPCPWDPSVMLTGAIDRAREDLAANGYKQIQVDNADGGKDPRWVLVEDDDAVLQSS